MRSIQGPRPRLNQDQPWIPPSRSNSISVSSLKNILWDRNGIPLPLDHDRSISLPLIRLKMVHRHSDFPDQISVGRLVLSQESTGTGIADSSLIKAPSILQDVTVLRLSRLKQVRFTEAWKIVPPPGSDVTSDELKKVSPGIRAQMARHVPYHVPMRKFLMGGTNIRVLVFVVRFDPSWSACQPSISSNREGLDGTLRLP